jgi:type I restriction enzyme R subunit
VVEAEAEYKQPGDGLQQAMNYAETLGVKFAYASNGHGIVEHDVTTGQAQARSASMSCCRMCGQSA